MPGIIGKMAGGCFHFGYIGMAAWKNLSVFVQCHKLKTNLKPECKHGVALGKMEFLRKYPNFMTWDFITLNHIIIKQNEKIEYEKTVLLSRWLL